MPEDSIEVDLLYQIALNRLRFCRDQAIEAHAHRESAPLVTLLQLRRTLDSLERAFLRLSNTLDARHRKKPPVNNRITSRWIDPRTGRTWRISDDRNKTRARVETGARTGTLARPATARTRCHHRDTLPPCTAVHSWGLRCWLRLCSAASRKRSIAWT